MNQAASEIAPRDRRRAARAGRRRAARRPGVVPPRDAPGRADRDALGRPRAFGCSAAAAWAAPRCPAASGTARAASRCTRCGPRSTSARPRRKTTFGIIGVKVWVYHGDEIPQAEQETERSARPRARAGRRSGGASTGALITDEREAAEVAEPSGRRCRAGGAGRGRRGAAQAEARPRRGGRRPAEAGGRLVGAGSRAEHARRRRRSPRAAAEPSGRRRGGAGLMLAPKKVKHRKVHRGRRRGRAKGGTEVHFGDYGLVALEAGVDHEPPDRGGPCRDDPAHPPRREGVDQHLPRQARTRRSRPRPGWARARATRRAGSPSSSPAA